MGRRNLSEFSWNGMSLPGTKTTFTQPRLKVRLPALNRPSRLNIGFSIAA